MSRASLSGVVREEIGKTGLKGVRRDHFVPGILYGHHRESTPVKMEANELEKFLKHHGIGANLDFTVGSKSHNVIIKDIQWNHMKGQAIHVDFQELQAGEKVRVTIPVRILNKAAVEDSRSVLTEVIHEVELYVLPKDLIESVEVDVSHLKHGENIKVEDLSIFGDARYELNHDADEIVVTLTEAKAYVEEEASADMPMMPDEELSTL
ncbi:MAG: 50S ribosomal protein L25 [Clostridia bacterium]|nr:50S ribosomal protein L25 [Clostridia bacterium]